MNRLLIIISSMTFGGAEMQTLELANGLLDKGYRIDIVVLDSQQEIIQHAKPEISFHIMKKQHYLDLSVARNIKKIIEQQKPDLIFCVDLYPLLYMRLIQNRSRKPLKIVTVLHSTLPRNVKDKFQRFYLTRLLKSASRVVFVSKMQKKYWLAKHPIAEDKAVCIHNGIAIENFSEYLEKTEEIQKEKEKCGFGLDDIVLGNCSSFRVEKRHYDLIQALSNLRGQGYPVKLLLIGDGKMRLKMEKQIAQLGLEQDVVITGHVLDVRSYLAVVDIFALTSDSVETLSIAAIESQAMKKAAILSDIGGASEIVEDGINGFLYQAGNVEQLTERLETMLQNKTWKTMGEAAYQHAQRNFHKVKMVRDYDELFRKVISENTLR